MMQGDAYHIPMEIYVEDVKANGDTFADVEIFVGKLRKSMSAGEIVYSQEENAFAFPVTQQETQRLTDGLQPVQVRVKMKNGDVIGTHLPPIDVIKAISKVVL